MKTVLVINKQTMGHGPDEDLGRRVLGTLFTKALGAFSDLEAIVFYNSGVFCLVADSPHLPPLSTLDERGVDLIACGTCVDAYGVREKIRVGSVGSMDQILAELEKAEKVITL